MKRYHSFHTAARTKAADGEVVSIAGCEYEIVRTSRTVTRDAIIVEPAAAVLTTRGGIHALVAGSHAYAWAVSSYANARAANSTAHAQAAHSAAYAIAAHSHAYSWDKNSTARALHPLATAHPYKEEPS